MLTLPQNYNLKTAAELGVRLVCLLCMFNVATLEYCKKATHLNKEQQNECIRDF